MLPSFRHILHHRVDSRPPSLSGYGGTFAIRYQRRKSKKQLKEQEGREYPDYLMACVGGGSNAAGTIYHYIDDERVQIVLAEAGGKGIDTGFLGRYHPTGENGNYPRSTYLCHPKRGRTDRGTILHFRRTGLSGHWSDTR